MKTVHPEMALSMVNGGDAEELAAPGRGKPVRAIMLVCRSLPQYVGRPKALSPASYGCARYVRKVVVQGGACGATFGAYYEFKKIDPDEHKLTVVGRTWGR